MCSGHAVPDVGEVSWQDYEELVKDIYQALGSADGVTIECWGRTCKVEGPPGVFHQIDVLTRHTAGMYEYRTAIECKRWNRKVGPRVVRELAQIVQDAGLAKGVVVSKMGFSDQAKALAESHNIGLVELRKPIDKDWDGYIREIPVRVTYVPGPMFRPRLNVTIPKDHPKRYELAQAIANTPIQPDRCFIDSRGERSESLEVLIKAGYELRTDREKFDLTFPTGSMLVCADNPEHPAHGIEITGLSVEVKQGPPIEEEMVIRADDHVYMIMESLFEGRCFTITKDGTIVKSDR